MAERIQKMLSRAGYGSRREIERWIEEGLIMVNGHAATPGQAIEETDQVVLRGQRLRLSSRLQAKPQVLIYHKKVGKSVPAMTLKNGRPCLRIYPSPTVVVGFKLDA